ncbi:MAG TPA: YsnF/AvaK domain-containing protein [Actinomycetes bacterium]|nr:YsnF/AvaK domain-containing protein [Actinomycetes bacterium]
MTERKSAQEETRVQSRAEPERLERVEERLVADVTQHQAGSVRLQKRVVEEPEEVEVTLRHDELDLERRPADRPLAAGEQPVSTAGETTVVLVVEERLQVQRVPWVVEEIHLRRRLVTETERITDTVRKERWEIQPEGDVKLDEH